MVVSIIYGIHVWMIVDSDKEFIVEKLEERFVKRAAPAYALLAVILAFVGYTAYHEKNTSLKRDYVALISLSLAAAVTGISSHVKLLTLPAFAVIFFWVLTHSVF